MPFELVAVTVSVHTIVSVVAASSGSDTVIAGALTAALIDMSSSTETNLKTFLEKEMKNKETTRIIHISSNEYGHVTPKKISKMMMKVLKKNKNVNEMMVLSDGICVAVSKFQKRDETHGANVS